MSNHTPGPWNTILSGASEYAGMAETECNVQSEYTNVATVHAGIGYAEFVANARLIAAAPELLASCRKLLEALQSHIRDDAERLGISEHTLCPCSSECVKDAQEAIRKATEG